ncbi:MAG: hypothetical protein IH593_11070, partial [Bacteroidales bacterium]|nr:hypothetical protein [Bacteroidales bacterium]
AFCDSVITVTPDDYAVNDLDTISYKPAAAPESVKPAIYTYGRHRMYAFTVAPSKQYLTFTERKSSALLSFGLALPSDTAQFSVTLTGATPESWYMENNIKRDTFRIWITEDSVYNRDLIEALVTYPFTDSAGITSARLDTVALRYVKPAPPRGTVRRTAANIRTNLGMKIRPGTKPWFEGSAPMNRPDSSRIILRQIIDTVSVEVPITFFIDSLDSRRYWMEAALTPGRSYNLTCLDSAFSDIYHAYSDSIVYKFAVTTAEDYGSVTAKLSGYEGAVIVQLLGDRERIVREATITSPGSVKFDLLEKGKYRMKTVYDIDNNGEWTTGSYTPLVSPEPVTYYKGELDVKSNREMEQDWDIGTKNIKDISLRSKPEIKR